MRKSSLFSGISAEAKPTYAVAVEGSFFWETDTKTLYVLNGVTWEVVSGNSGTASTFINGVVLTQANWVLSGGLYEYTYSNAEFLTTSVVNVVPVNASMSIVQTAIMYPLVTVSNGSIKMYCQNAPTGDITINITVGV